MPVRGSSIILNDAYQEFPWSLSRCRTLRIMAVDLQRLKPHPDTIYHHCLEVLPLQKVPWSYCSQELLPVGTTGFFRLLSAVWASGGDLTCSRTGDTAKCELVWGGGSSQDQWTWMSLGFVCAGPAEVKWHHRITCDRHRRITTVAAAEIAAGIGIVRQYQPSRHKPLCRRPPTCIVFV
jgi:hypothetical protein